LDPAIVAFLSIFGGFLAGSGGFWVYLTKKFQREDRVRQLIMGLAHDKIVYLGIKYIEKGFVTKDEYDDLFKYFWDPYEALGGDGSAERIIRMVQLLPLTPERRGDPEVREATDKLITGADKVIERVERGDDTLESNR
jgi:hypothetical protein